MSALCFGNRHKLSKKLNFSKKLKKETERMSAAPAVTTADFDTLVLEAETPVLVDFWAVWCGPCRTIAPAVDAVAEEYAGRARVFKLNVDENPEIAGRYGVQSIPTLIVFKDGQKVKELVGGQNTKQTLGAALAEQL